MFYRKGGLVESTLSITAKPNVYHKFDTMTSNDLHTLWFSIEIDIEIVYFRLDCDRYNGYHSYRILHLKNYSYDQHWNCKVMNINLSWKREEIHAEHKTEKEEINGQRVWRRMELTHVRCLYWLDLRDYVNCRCWINNTLRIDIARPLMILLNLMLIFTCYHSPRRHYVHLYKPRP